MPKIYTKLTWSDSHKLTLRTSAPKELREELGLTDEDSLVWEWLPGGKEARVRKA